MKASEESPAFLLANASKKKAGGWTGEPGSSALPISFAMYGLGQVIFLPGLGFLMFRMIELP